MKILMIGGGGFIGSATAQALSEAGHDVVVADIFDPQIHGADIRKSPTFQKLGKDVEIQVADARDPSAMEPLVRQADAVYFFAAGTGTGQSMYQVRRYCDVNVMGAAVLAESLAAHRDGLKRVVLSSSRAVYGEGAYQCAAHGNVTPAGRTAERISAGNWEPSCPICKGALRPLASKETDALLPTSIYGTTKLAQEQILFQSCQGFGIPFVAYRYQNVYGPGQSLRNPYTGILSIFSQLLAKREEVNVFEDGLPTRDFVHIADIVHYNVRALELPPSESVILNVGSGRGVTLIEVVKALAAALGVDAGYRISGEFRAGDIRHACADLSALAAKFGARKFIRFEDGVRDLVDWISRQESGGLSGLAYRKSLDEMREAGLLGGSR
jgi:dTDP-L-rhamnose 4-epimerase